TLTGLPDGGIAVSASSLGYLTGLAVGRIDGHRGQAHDLLIQPLTAPVRVGPDGGSFSGPGWRVEVPAGALPAPADLSLTSLAITGALDSFGAPVVDLSPTGLSFAAPITVAVDPTVAGFDPATARVVG